MRLFSRTTPAPAAAVTFTLESAGFVYPEGQTGLEPTTLTIGPSDRRVALIGLNGSGKTTLLKLLDGALAATSGTVRITPAGVDGAPAGAPLDPSRRGDAKRVGALVGRVRREEIPDAYYRADSIRQAVAEPLRRRRMDETSRQALIGNLFAHFDLAQVAHLPASALNAEQRHLLAIAGALSLSPAVIVADEPTKGLDEVASAHVAAALFSYDRQVVFATHDTTLITRPEYAIGRVLVLDDHRVVVDGPPADAVARYEDLIRARYRSARGFSAH